MSIQFPSHQEIRAAFKRGEDDVVALFDKVGQQIIELAEQLTKQAEIIKELQAKAAKDSRNSGKPPSSDGYGKPNLTQSLRKPGQHSNGGQQGHTGTTLEVVANPDHTEPMIRTSVLCVMPHWWTLKYLESKSARFLIFRRCELK